jgi:nitroreductase
MPSADQPNFAAFKEMVEQRYSARAYRSELLSDDTIHTLLSLAQRAPSDCNTQPWAPYIVSGERLDDLRERLTRCVSEGRPQSHDLPAIESYEGVFRERRRACGYGLYEAVGIAKGDREASQQQALENFRFFGAPHIAVMTCHSSLGERGVLDLGIYMGFFLLAAQSLGIAAIPQAAPSNFANELREIVGVAPEHRIACVITFGHADPAHLVNHYRTDRADLSEAVPQLG